MMSPKNKTSIVLSTGQLNDVTDERFALCECSDGQLYYVTSKQASLASGIQSGAVVRFEVQSSKKVGHWRTVAILLDSTSVENQISKKGQTWLDSLTESDLKRTHGSFGKVVTSSWKQRQLFLFEQGIETAHPKLRIKAVQDLRLSNLISAIETRTEKRFVNNPKRFTGNLTSNHTDYSVVENGNEFTLVRSTPHINKALNRQVELSIGANNKQKVFVQPVTVCPITLEDASADVHYNGPTWLDRQIIYPDNVIAPAIRPHLDALKAARQKVLISNKIVSDSSEIGNVLPVCRAKWARRNRK